MDLLIEWTTACTKAHDHLDSAEVMCRVPEGFDHGLFLANLQLNNDMSVCAEFNLCHH